MSSVCDDDWGENYSVIGDQADVGFLDYQDQSFHNFNPTDEGPVVISMPFPFVNGNPQSALIGERAVDLITLRNTADDPIDLWAVTIYSSNPEGAYTLSVMEPPSDMSDVDALSRFLELTSLEDRVLQPGQTLKIWLSCKPIDIGLQTGIVHFNVGDDKIERVVFLLAEDKFSQLLASSKPYSRVRKNKQFGFDQYVRGSPPASRATREFKFRLPAFQIPPDAREMIERKSVPEFIMEGLTVNSYVAYFHHLLYMEELQLEEDMRRHDMECVTMKNKGYQFLVLEVPGLAERRPSLVVGDFIFVKLANEDFDDATKPYQGHIHRVEADEVFLKFAKEFHQSHCEGQLYNVRFLYNRLNMRRLYQAVQATQYLPKEFLFPSKSSKRRLAVATEFIPLNPALNEEQISSVEMILQCKGAPPYVIHGPPGTGKTVTLVEAILQLYMRRKNARILVCSPSNSSADHLLEKLIKNDISAVQENEIFRLNAPSRAYEDVPPEIIQFCFFDDLVFKCPPLKALLYYKIIICTYMSASLLYAEGVPRNHVSHIFLDEAGQASEPETMVPLSNLCRKDTVFVLAGDPLQLGPVVFSKDAENYGLGKSYLERLFECEPYSSGSKCFITKLVRNYRCHLAILALPSELFYRGELIACRGEEVSYLYEWIDLPNKSFPVLFIGIQGCDEREGNNPSWFNRVEASKVIDVILKLKDNIDVSEVDIGVITPYRQQVLKIKKALESLEMGGVKVGSVEQFQGQEREVIIVSTVRSTAKHNEFDRKYLLGFLSNPRRFNVAVTRARSLLIIVGNPHIISKDAYWDKILRLCSDNNSYQGCPLPEKNDDYIQGPSWEDSHSYQNCPLQEKYGDYNQGPSGEDGLNDDEIPKPFSGEVGGGKESFRVEEIPKPVFDEAEWSDGWS